jgi:hypothetical protein
MRLRLALFRLTLFRLTLFRPTLFRPMLFRPTLSRLALSRLTLFRLTLSLVTLSRLTRSRLTRSRLTRSHLTHRRHLMSAHLPLGRRLVRLLLAGHSEARPSDLPLPCSARGQRSPRRRAPAIRVRRLHVPTTAWSVLTTRTSRMRFRLASQSSRGSWGGP